PIRFCRGRCAAARKASSGPKPRASRSVASASWTRKWSAWRLIAMPRARRWPSWPRSTASTRLRFGGRLASALRKNWRLKARPEPLPPLGDWKGWVVCAGRGFGKTRTGAELVRELVETGAAGRIALIGPTAADVRDVMVEGPAGVLAVSSSWFRPEY